MSSNPGAGLDLVTATKIEKERQQSCPICGSDKRRVVHDDVLDFEFLASNESWCVSRCLSCRSVYLDPRPTRDTIVYAYQGYYTHDPLATVSQGANGRSSLVGRLKNGILNLRFGTVLAPAKNIPLLTDVASRLLIGSAARRYRCFPRLRAGARILDVGCGSGKFLALATHSGWSAVGVDFDAKAVQAAKSMGLAASVGDIFAPELAGQAFDAITFNHSFEHLYEPQKNLSKAFELLVGGGALHLELPNPESWGCFVFGRYWRGHEAPRHIVLPSQGALRELLRLAGFSRVEFYRAPSATKGIFQSSMSAASKSGPVTLSQTLATFLSRLSYVMPARTHEFTCVVAKK